MAAAAILKIVKLPYLSRGLSDVDEILYDGQFNPFERPEKSKMAAVAILKNRKIAISRPRFNRY